MSARIRIDGVGVEFDCAAGDTVLRAGLRAGLGVPYECSVGACGTCKMELVAGELESLRADAPGLSVRDRARGRWLACQARPHGDCTVRLRLDEACRPRQPPAARMARLAGIEDLTHDLREFRFVAAGPARFLPGQYALLTVPGVEAPRAYSMSNLPNDEGHWHFQIRRVPHGRATQCLFDALRPGDAITIDAPFGMAYLRDDAPRDVVCIAGGSGLAPMVSVARGAADSPALRSRRLHFFYGARTPRDVCGEPLLAALPGFGDRIRYHAAVSDAGAAAPWRRGFVHELVGDTLGDALAGCEIYLAGPPPMVEAVEQLLAERRVPREQVHFDRFF